MGCDGVVTGVAVVWQAHGRRFDPSPRSHEPASPSLRPFITEALDARLSREWGPPSRCSLRPQSQPAAQLRPEKLQRSARKRSHSTNTRTVPTPRTATFLTHRLTIASENSRQPRVRGGEKSVTSAAHAAAITTTSARSMNRRPVIPVAPGVHRGGLPGDEEIPQAAGYDGARKSPAAWPRRYRKRQDAEEVVSAATAPGPSR